MTSRLIPAFILLAFLAFTAGCSSSIEGIKDFSYVPHGWDMFRNSDEGVSHDTIDLAEDLELIWDAEFDGRIYSPPVINNGLGVLPTLDENLYYFDPATGAEIGSVEMGSAVSAAPALAENLLYIAEEKEDGHLRCININNGKEVWKRETGDVSSPIVISDRMVFVGNFNGTFYSINRLTGETNWTVETGKPIKGGAAVADGSVYFGSTDGKVYCVNLTDGEILWTFDTGQAIYTSPAVTTTCYVTSTNGNLYALDASTGYLIWRFPTEGQIFSSPVASRNAVFFGSNDGYLYSVSRSGRLRWRFAAGSIVNATPLVTSDRVVAGTGDGRIVSLDIEDGGIRREFAARSGIRAAPVYYGGNVYVACTEKRLYCIGQPDSTQAEMAE